MISVAIKQKAKCSGCNACAEACPKFCIEMIPDKKGFFYPKVDNAVCIDCGICENVCPFENVIEINTPLAAYAAWNKNRKQYLASSSGGVAYVFSYYIVEQGGVVYGCTFDGVRARHIRVDALSDLYKLQGSKYVQSDVKRLFGYVRADLKVGKPVLFIGTPCQVAGLKSYIRHIPSHLYLVDLICHGVPSQKMLLEHVGQIVNNRSAEQLSFRKGQLYRLEIMSQGGTVYSSEPHKDMYYRAFLSGISYRESCYKCPFARKERVGDITIGDFWGLQNTASLPLKTEEGVSVLLPSTEKGKALIAAVKSSLNIYERSVDEAVNGNDQLRFPVKKALPAKIFDVLYPVVAFDKVVTVCVAGQKFYTVFKIIGRKVFR